MCENKQEVDRKELTLLDGKMYFNASLSKEMN